MTPVEATWVLLRSLKVTAFRQRLVDVGLPFLVTIEPLLLEEHADAAATALEEGWSMSRTDLTDVLERFGTTIGLTASQRRQLVQCCTEELPHDPATAILVSAAIDEVWQATYRSEGRAWTPDVVDLLREVVPRDRWHGDYLAISDEVAGVGEDDPVATAARLFDWMIERRALAQVRGVLEAALSERAWRQFLPRTYEAISRVHGW